MKACQKFVPAITATVILIILSGAVYADIPVQPAPDLAGISTVTLMDAQGITTTSTEVSLLLGTGTLDNPPLNNGGFVWSWFPYGKRISGYSVDPYVISRYKGAPVPQGDVQYSAVYNEVMSAVTGHIIYQKTTGISTAAKSASEDTIAAERQFTFTGGDGGRMTTTEEMLIDGAGAQTASANQAFCSFSGESTPFFPPFCNIVMSGSNADISTGSISTLAAVRSITASANVPVAETYRINVKGVTETGGYSGASGTVSVFVKAHIQEGIEQPIPRRFVSDPAGFNPVKAEDISYSETTTVSGLIYSFTKNMEYQSGKRPV